jgi:DNA-binding response OmpR family regulator
MDKKTIYIAEDNPVQMVLMRAALSPSEEYAVSFFTDGLEAYQQVQERKPDLLILDIILPSLSGLAVCRLLKFHNEYKVIPILVTSSITDMNLKARVQELGAGCFLPKPFTVEQFLEAIRSLFQNYS